MKLFTTGQLVRFLHHTFLIGLFISVAVYIWVRLLFFEAALSFHEEMINLFKVIMTGWAMMIILKGTFNAMLLIGERLPELIAKNKFAGPVLMILATGGILAMYML